VLTFSRRAVVAVIVIYMASGSLELCAGWQASPAARVACCEDELTCPQHPSSDAGAMVTPTQAAADLCCATSEQNDSPQQASAVHSATTVAPIVSVTSHTLVPTTTLLHFWPPFVPPPGRQIHTHLLFSVFLI